MSTPGRLSPTLSVLIAVLLFSTGGLFIKMLVAIDALPLAGLRSLLAAVFVFAYLLLTRNPRTLLQLSPVGWVATAAYMGMIIAFVTATKLTTAANAILLQYTMPAWVLIGGWLWLREKVTLNQVLTISLCLIGMILFFNERLEPRQWNGNALAVFSGVALAVFVLCVRRDRRHDPLRSVFWANLFTALLLVPYSFISDPQLADHVFTLRALSILLWLGFFQLGLAYIFYVNAITGLPALEVAILSLLEPVLNPIWVFLFVSEIPSFWSLMGGGLILLSVLLHSLLTASTKNAETPVSGGEELY